MKNRITIREAVTEKDIRTFWEQLYAYFKRDILPDPGDEDREYFLGSDYRNHMQMIHDRNEDRCYYLFFERDGLDIGFALPVVFTSEDGKCFVMEFCVLPEYRGSGTGRGCAEALREWTGQKGALYWELNYGGNERRRRFWKSVGFIENGADEWGDALMILPPAEDIAVCTEVLAGDDDWQLLKLENGFKREIGEDALTEEKQKILQQAVKDGKITFFVARRGYRMVGMCSVARCFSTFTCADTGIFEDFYIEPVFRKKGIARMLANAAQTWCREKGISSLTVSCAPCDAEMYRALGFDTVLGTTVAHVE